jgi:hypothetical protein
VQLKLENSYEAGDGFEIQYFGCEHAKFKACQAEAALLADFSTTTIAQLAASPDTDASRAVAE